MTVVEIMQIMQIMRHLEQSKKWKGAKVKRSLPKPPPPKTAMAASSARTGDAGQHRQEQRYDHPSPEPVTQRCALLGSVSPEQWPVTITWPPGAAVAVIGGQWRRLPDGRIEAIYLSLPELRTAITLTQYAREWSAPMEQAVMFSAPAQGNYEEK